MKPDTWASALARWAEAGLVDAEAAGRIRAFEAARAEEGGEGLRWPVLLAFGLGALMVGAGTLLFVAAHWDGLGPAARMTLVLALLALFHGAAVLATEGGHGKLATTLHGLGTVALGAGIFLSGQIFHLQEHWPGGLLLWALGAGVGWLLLRDWVQGALFALLAPAWLAGEWTVWAEARQLEGQDGVRILVACLLLLACSYLTARRGTGDAPLRRALGWIGGLALLPFGIATVALAAEEGARLVGRRDLHWMHLVLVLALGLLLALVPAFLLRRREARWNLLALVWVAPTTFLAFGAWTAYAWAALGCAGLAAWGLREARRERVNLAVAGFAVTVLAFYFSRVMDKLGRSLGLLGLGLLFLAGGWQLERLRRRLNARIGGGAR